ncbi:MAG: hypothetical protein ABWZ15_05015 [Acidimicrobiia bacterium]
MTKLATVLLYAAIDVSFFLVACELHVAAGWSAFEAATALLPATVLMLWFSAKSGELGQRIGPRLQLTVGSILVAAGLLFLSRIGPDSSWLPDVLPGAIVLGLGTHPRARLSARRAFCSVDGPPLQPDRARGPVAQAT